MGVYGNQALNEAIFFLPPEGKKFKKEVNEKLKEMRRGVFQNMLSKYNQNDIKEVKSFLKTKYKNFTMSPMITVVTTVNGATTTEYYKGVTGILSNGYMYFKCYFRHNGAVAYGFNYIEKSKCIVPEDVIEKAIDLSNEKVELILSKNKIKVISYSSGYLSDEIYGKLSDYALSKYGDEYLVSKSLLGGLSFKKK